jgi:hypothetical protein
MSVGSSVLGPDRGWNRSVHAGGTGTAPLFLLLNLTF